MKWHLSLWAVLAGLTLAAPAWAGPNEGPAATESISFEEFQQDRVPFLAAIPGDALADEDEDEDDALDDILNEGDTVKKEVDDVKSGDLDDSIGVKRESEVILPEEEMARKKRIIKTLQKKNFLKLGRWEVGPHMGAVVNDPFLKRYIGGAYVTRHFTEVFSGEVDFGFAPDLGEADWKDLTNQLKESNRVLPDISKLLFYGTFTFGFSPIYGKVAVGQRIIIFDIFGVFGMGAVRTADDLNALGVQGSGDEADRAKATQYQVHPTTNLGGGLRVALSPNVAVRLEGRSLVYIETVQSTTLEMKNNLILQGSVSFFFPFMRS